MNKKRRELAYKFSRRTNAQWKDLHWNSKLCGANLLQFIILLVVILPLLRSEVLAQTRIVQAIPTKSFGYLPLFVAQENGFYNDESLEVISPSCEVCCSASGASVRRNPLWVSRIWHAGRHEGDAGQSDYLLL